ncbi:hypothetical protein MGU_07594 [Metarhizium guizhouense ARSEF 977]|uniref:Uncharacterized protein n=1 Tax=Metarhizium guizhouense (strain ARSEF 977) TaxID=1276136 RepID=A0A0B4GZM5_METGA|nr:hypothetical protein MGU_07594 [Metarhizium guizhouense ARSEF 977]
MLPRTKVSTSIDTNHGTFVPPTRPNDRGSHLVETSPSTTSAPGESWKKGRPARKSTLAPQTEDWHWGFSSITAEEDLDSMRNTAAESDIDDLDESKLSEADDDSPSEDADGQQFNCETIDCLMLSNELYRIVEALDPEMLDIGSSK